MNKVSFIVKRASVPVVKKSSLLAALAKVVFVMPVVFLVVMVLVTVYENALGIN